MPSLQSSSPRHFHLASSLSLASLGQTELSVVKIIPKGAWAEHCLVEDAGKVGMQGRWGCRGGGDTGEVAEPGRGQGSLFPFWRRECLEPGESVGTSGLPGETSRVKGFWRDWSPAFGMHILPADGLTFIL